MARVKVKRGKGGSAKQGGSGGGKAVKANAALSAGLPERHHAALELRKLGHSYPEIAAQLGCALSTAHGWVQAALAELRALVGQEAEAVRELEDARLDLLTKRLLHTVQTGTPDQATRAAQAAVKASESRRKLWGVDLAPPEQAPPEVDVTVVIGGAPSGAPEEDGGED